MKTAYLDCVNKTLKVDIVGEAFTLELTGDSTEIGTVRTKQGDYLTHFDFSKSNPQLSIGKKDAAMDYIQKGDIYSLVEAKEEYNVIIDRGSSEDYFGVSYPNGIISYMETYGVMMREAPTIRFYDDWVSKTGSITMLETIRFWALEFEKAHENTQWEEEDTDWDEQVIEFLTLKLRN